MIRPWSSTQIKSASRTVEMRCETMRLVRARNRGALLLATGERDAALADERLEIGGEAADVAAQAGDFRRPFHLGAFRLVDAEGDVFGERVAEKKRLLRHIADASA